MGPKMAVKWVGVFCNGYNELAFLCNGTDRHEIPAKMSIAVLYWTLIEEVWKFTIKGLILHQTAIFGLLWRLSLTQAYMSGVTFSTYRGLPSTRGRANGVPTLNRPFVRLTVSAVEAPKVIKISLSEPKRSLSGDTATDHGICFPFELCIPSYSGRSNGVHFLRRLLHELPFRRYKAFKSPTLFSKFRRRYDYEHGCHMLFSI